MKKLSLVFGIALVAFIVIVGHRIGHKNEASVAKASVAVHAAPREPLESDTDSSHELVSACSAAPRATDSNREREDIKKLRRELESVKVQLENITRPLERDVLSSTVNAEIKPGETLVTGGYRTADGSYEMTFLTPRSVTLEDGREAFEVDGKVLSVGSEFAEVHGLESLATNARNTLQHAEAWTPDDVAGPLAAGRDAEGVGMMTTPKVTVLPSTPFALRIDVKNGTKFSIEGTVARSPNGSYAIQSRIERTPAPQK